MKYRYWHVPENVIFTFSAEYTTTKYNAPWWGYNKTKILGAIESVKATEIK